MSGDIVRDTLEKHLRYVRSSGSGNLSGPCPFHNNGMEKRPSFYMNANNGLFYCHSCHASGNFKTFLRLVGVRKSDIADILDGASFETQESIEKKRDRIDVSRTKDPLNESLLGVFDYAPTELLHAGFDKRLLRSLDIGFDKLHKRITFPIRDLYGNLAGISGRAIGDAFPRYLVYGARELLDFAPDNYETQSRYKKYSIKSHNYIWNMDRLYPSVFFGDELDTIVITEGYKACTWLIQHGIDNTVALQGSRLTWAQERILSRINTTYVLMLDNDKAGKHGTSDLGHRLSMLGHRVRCCVYPPEAKQPDDLSEDEILEVLDSSTTLRRWRRICHIPTPSAHRSHDE